MNANELADLIERCNDCGYNQDAANMLRQFDLAESIITQQKVEIEAEALAQTQEPVAWLEPEWGEKICPEVGYEVTMTDDHPRDLCWIPLYAHPPQSVKTKNIGCLGMPVNVPVTESTQKERLIRIMGTFDLATGHSDIFDELLDSLESELRDVLGHYREALSQPLQSEPVAWMFQGAFDISTYVSVEKPNPDIYLNPTPLYTHPVKELTDEETINIIQRLIASWSDGFRNYTYDSDEPEENKLRDDVFAILRKAQEK